MEKKSIDLGGEKVCPHPNVWNEVYEKLSAFAKENPCLPPSPPEPLILAGWAYSNDAEKRQRWVDTENWANANFCSDIIINLQPKDFYFANFMSSREVSPSYGPMYLPWNYDSKPKLPLNVKDDLIKFLKENWHNIVGAELSKKSKPLKFSGKKSRRLLCIREQGVDNPPWGSWRCLSADRDIRFHFTQFRRTINQAISPHEVDHIDFI